MDCRIDHVGYAGRMAPVPSLKAAAVLACGLALGLGLSFLRSDFAGGDPESCRSCHTMEKAFSTWRSGVHRQQPCGDCHLPQGPLAGSWSKAVDGLQHAVVYATGRDQVYHRLASPTVVEANCRRCHPSAPGRHPVSSRPCLDCHTGTAHGTPALARR